MTADMHVEGRGRGAQQVVMHRRDLEAALQQLHHHRIDLGFEQNEVAHDHGAAMRRHERDPAAERQGRLDGDAVQRHVEIAARETVTVNLAGHGRRPAEGGIDLLPVDLLGVGRAADQDGRGAK